MFTACSPPVAKMIFNGTSPHLYNPTSSNVPKAPETSKNVQKHPKTSENTRKYAKNVETLKITKMTKNFSFFQVRDTRRQFFLEGGARGGGRHHGAGSRAAAAAAAAPCPPPRPRPPLRMNKCGAIIKNAPLVSPLPMCEASALLP